MTASPPEPPDAIHAIAAEAIGVLGTGRQIAPFSERFPDLTLAEAYRVTHAVRGLREARGERPVGRKIGFTNRTIWDEYGVHAPIWSFVYDRTVLDLAECGGAFALYGLAEPRIEPEIVFGLAVPAEPGVDAAGLLSAIAWVAPGFEIVQSIFPGWRFSPADTVIGFGLHGALLVGPRVAIGPAAGGWADRLARFTVDLHRDGAPADRGRAQNVLDGPLFALRHVIDVLAQDPVNPPLQAGKIVTTGTLTRALPVRSGETWTAAFDGVPLEGIAVHFA
jgi:2-oxo-3-hexenedioate decarboxylase